MKRSDRLGHRAAAYALAAAELERQARSLPGTRMFTKARLWETANELRVLSSEATHQLRELAGSSLRGPR